jgi:hypothetical protein
MSDDRAETQALAELLADPEIREAWEQELWAAFADRVIRWHFEQETGIGQQPATAGPLHGFTDGAARENDAYAWAFVQWFNAKCWPRR